MSGGTTEFVRLTGHRAFAQRLVLATLTGRPVHISKIRSSSPTNPGLASHEISFLRLLEAVTNGTSLQISYSGTTITYHPGLITGSVAGLGASAGDIIEHTVPAGCARGVTYFLIHLALLAPFAKAHMNVRMSGPGVITSATDAGDISIDSFRTAILPLYGLFGILPARIELRVLQRSCSGGGGGAVEMRFASQIRLPKTLHLNRTPGRVRRIRGVAYSTGVPASNNSRMIYSAREVLNPLVSDINIAAQYDKAPRGGPDSKNNKGGIGFGLCLVAETNSEGVIYSADLTSPSSGGVVPEDMGKKCAYQLLEIISQGGCTSWAASSTVLTLMAMGSEDVGRLRMGRDVLGSEEVIGLAKDLKSFGCSSWGLRQIDQSDENMTDYVVSVKGSGVGNVGRKIS
ncbi:uncharacterized protein MKZ38_006450 [Zalerion maritima]|uniref:RNA 3'-terminal phosphate cyclase-like protein n=1 Tax=Zalerion maritima TaxID=339359 RepID=A0AAD5S3H1_9PEZI|nr:uncharacterized protein MKZ38_006450 [Zalerion maritima]